MIALSVKEKGAYSAHQIIEQLKTVQISAKRGDIYQYLY